MAFNLKGGEFTTRYLGKPYEERRCVDCAYCAKHLFYSGKWPCMNPDNYPGRPVPHDLPCFVRLGSKEGSKNGL